MSADEIRRLADKYEPNGNVHCIGPKEEQEVRAALLDYAAMVERCEQVKKDNASKSESFPITSDWMNQEIDYILSGDAGKETAMANKIYTAEDLRDTAENITRVDVMDGLTCREHCYPVKQEVKAMLRYAAEVVERYDAAVKLLDTELSNQKHCRNCEWRGKTIRGEPTCPCSEDEHDSVFDIDITDRFAKALRGDAGKEER